MSGLLLARGFVGPTGKIGMIDTESGRGSLYADVIQGGYDVLQLSEPFSPARYIEAIRAIENSGAGIGMIDSGSHEWEGLGGVLDMAGDRESKSGKPGLHNWREPKMEHAKFMLKLLQSPLPWIICLRAKHKTRQAKNQQGRTEIVKEDFTTPIQADDFIFEMTCHGEILQDHTFRLTKCSHPSLRQAMPNNEMTTIEHGKRLAEWCAAPGVSKPQDDIKSLRNKLWESLKDVRGQATKWSDVQQMLWDEMGMDSTKRVADLTADELKSLIHRVDSKLCEVTP